MNQINNHKAQPHGFNQFPEERNNFAGYQNFQTQNAQIRNPPQMGNPPQIGNGGMDFMNSQIVPANNMMIWHLFNQNIEKEKGLLFFLTQ